MATFSVSYVQERNQLGAGGRIQKMTVIHLKTFLGNEGTVELPSEHYQALTASEEGKVELLSILEEKASSLDTPLTF